MTSTERRGRRAAALLALVVATTSPAVARAEAPHHSAEDIAQARALFVKAKEQRASGDVAGSLEKFKAAHALGGTPLTALELGRTCEMLGLLVKAREAFLGVARLPLVAEETSRSADARREAAVLAEKLQARIPTVSIVVRGATGAEVAVSIDEATVPGAALVAPRPLNPGPHTVVATAGALRAESRFELRAAESRTVELELTAPVAPVLPPPTRESARSSGARVLASAAGGVGGAGLVAGAITGALAVHDAAAVKAGCQGTVCPTSIDGDLRTGRTLGVTSTVTFVFGGAGVAAGVIGLVVGRWRAAPPRAPRLRPWVGPRGGGIGGTF